MFGARCASVLLAATCCSRAGLVGARSGAGTRAPNGFRADACRYLRVAAHPAMPRRGAAQRVGRRAAPFRLHARQSHVADVLLHVLHRPLGLPVRLSDDEGAARSHRGRCALRSRVRFVNISFDPTHDTPDALRGYAKGLAGATGFEWQFFTARSMAELTPLLDGFGQDVRVETTLPVGRRGRSITC